MRVLAAVVALVVVVAGVTIAIVASDDRPAPNALFSILDRPPDGANETIAALRIAEDLRFGQTARTIYSDGEFSYIIAVNEPAEVCLIIAGADSAAVTCAPPAVVERRALSLAVETRTAETAAALVPDNFVGAAGLAELGEAHENIVLLRPGLPNLEITIRNEDLDELIVRPTGM